MTLGVSDLRALALQAGFPLASADVAAAIAFAESRGDPRSLGDSGTSYGLWQIHIPAHPQYSAAATSGALFDPLTNAQAALEVSAGGTNFHPWSTFNPAPDGSPPAYLAYLPANYAAAGGLGSADLLALLGGFALAMALDTRPLMRRARRALARLLRS